ncbi:hypothetical protein V8C44DRAFT_318393 [Trichoderma aethiopicum]
MIPLVIPSRFFSGWPTISTGFFLCWAYIWHQHTYAWIILFMELYFVVLCGLAFVGSLAGVLGERLRDEGPENQQRRNFLSETFSRAMPQWKLIQDRAWRMYCN